MKDSSMFTPAKVGRAGEDVALQIEAAILNGRISPGESLPSERELQTVFKTGRGVVREALGALKQKGLIEVKKGAKGGAFVRQVQMANVSESLALFIKQHTLNPRYLIEFRESIDRTITALAIARADADAKRALVEAAHALQQQAADAENLDSLVEMDRQLNIQFARMAGNPIFEWTMHAVQAGLTSGDYSLYTDLDYRQKTLDNWVQTAQAIADNDQLRALSYIGYHYVLLRRCVEQSPAQE